MADPKRSSGRAGRDAFDLWAASLIVVNGPDRGEEHAVEAPHTVLGRGPGVDLAFDDPEMSQRHSEIDFRLGRFEVVDLDSTNGTEVNGTGVSRSELAHGDRIRIGRHVLQILIEQRRERRGFDA